MPWDERKLATQRRSSLATEKGLRLISMSERCLAEQDRAQLSEAMYDMSKLRSQKREIARRGLLRSLFSWAWKCAAVLLLLLSLAALNNNYSLRRIPRADFCARLDRSVEASTNWMYGHPEILGNPSLMFMVADMEKMSGDPRLRQMLDQYRRSKYVTDPLRPFGVFGPVWARMVDPQAPVPMIDMTQVVPDQGLPEILWDAYAVVPDRVAISYAQRVNMFSPTKYYWGKRHHQLLALVMYRYYNGGSEELNRTINYLAEKVARDAHFDFRVSDSYVQRNAFILGAGRTDLIRSRWIERVLDYQRPDGSWAYCWYSWCRGILEFRLGDVGPDHSTVQAAWALYMLKYRFPQWIEQHYR